MQWVLQPTKLAKAAKMLGVRLPVLVDQTKGWWAGTHYVVPTATDHIHRIHSNRVIKIHDQWSPSFTIWHELTHALQFERDYQCDFVKWMASLKIYDNFIDWDGEEPTPIDYNEDWEREYRSIPREREANEIAWQYAFKYPLITLRA